MSTDKSAKMLRKEGFRLYATNGLTFMFWRHGKAEKGEANRHETYKTCKTGAEFEAFEQEWYSDL